MRIPSASVLAIVSSPGDPTTPQASSRRRPRVRAASSAERVPHVVLPDRLPRAPREALGQRRQRSVARPLLLAVVEVETPGCRSRRRLQLAGPRRTHVLVPLQRRLYAVRGDVGETLGEDVRVLDRLRSALRLERLHRVRRVAEQRRASPRPAVERPPDEDGAAKERLARTEPRMHPVVPPLEVRPRLVDGGSVRPRLPCPFGFLYREVDREELAARDPVRDSVAPRAEPVAVEPVGVDALDGRTPREAAVDNGARKDGLVGADERLADRRLDPVGGDERVAGDARAVVENRCDGAVSVVDVGDARTEPYDAGGERIEQR